LNISRPKSYHPTPVWRVMGDKRKCGVVHLSDRRLWQSLSTNKQNPTLE